MKRAKTPRDIFRAEPTADLICLLETGKPGEQECASFELGRRGAREATALLRMRLESPNHSVRAAAAEALGRIGDQDSGKDLLKLFRNRRQPDSVRDTSAYSLALLHYRPAIPELLTALSDPSPSVRLCVVAALAAIKDPRTVLPLRLAKETETDSAVRDGIRKALTVLTKHSARPLAMASGSRR
jgi:HEAT repeat protein